MEHLGIHWKRMEHHWISWNGLESLVYWVDTRHWSLHPKDHPSRGRGTLLSMGRFWSGCLGLQLWNTPETCGHVGMIPPNMGILYILKNRTRYLGDGLIWRWPHFCITFSPPDICSNGTCQSWRSRQSPWHVLFSRCLAHPIWGSPIWEESS